MIITTREQRAALMRVYQRNNPAPVHPINLAAWWKGYLAFRQTVQGGPGCIMVPWSGMWLGIEPDGYTHS